MNKDVENVKKLKKNCYKYKELLGYPMRNPLQGNLLQRMLIPLRRIVCAGTIIANREAFPFSELRGIPVNGIAICNSSSKIYFFKFIQIAYKFEMKIFFWVKLKGSILCKTILYFNRLN